MPSTSRLKDGGVRSVRLKVRGDKYRFFVELVKSLDFVKIESDRAPAAGREKECLVANIRKGFVDKKSIDAGTLKTYPAEGLFDE